jgi:hypothetical protein
MGGVLYYKKQPIKENVMKSLRPLLFFVSMLLIVGLAGGCRSAQEAESTGPKAIVEEPTAVLPTETPAPQSQGGEAQAFFGEEFDNPLSGDWTQFLYYDEKVSDPEAVQVQTDNGKLVWNFDTKELDYYLFYKAFSYQDVKIETRYDNRGVNNNYVSLICRYDAKYGWYEFQVANNGLYNIYAMEVLENGKLRENRLANGGSLAIKQGKGVNEYAATCEGDQLTLRINGEKVSFVSDQKYSMREGQVGVAVSSLNVLPVAIEIDFFKVTAP